MSASFNNPGNTTDLAERMASAITRQNEDVDNNNTLSASLDPAKGDNNNTDDKLASPFHNLSPEIRLNIYRLVFDFVSQDIWRDTEPKNCYPVPAIVQAWPKLHGECIGEWWKYLLDHSVRLKTRFDDVGKSWRRIANRSHTIRKNAYQQCFRNKGWLLLKLRQVDVLQNCCEAELLGARQEMKACGPLERLPWPDSIKLDFRMVMQSMIGSAQDDNLGTAEAG